MGKVTGFMEYERVAEPYRDVKNRLLDFQEIYSDHNTDTWADYERGRLLEGNPS